VHNKPLPVSLGLSLVMREATNAGVVTRDAGVQQVLSSAAGVVACAAGVQRLVLLVLSALPMRINYDCREQVVIPIAEG